jgi:hypothetical protein
MRRSAFLVVATTVLMSALSAPAVHAAVPRPRIHPVAVSCGFNADHGADSIDRGFYVSDYPARRISSVTLEYDGSDGTYGVTLTARKHTYDGEVLARVTESFSISGGFQRVRFPFGDLRVHRGTTITFSQRERSGKDLDFNTGNGDLGDTTFDKCQGVTETVATKAPLGTFRRASVGLLIRT